MKKILFAISMMFAMVACISEDLPQTTIPQEGDKVTLTFDVQVPDAKSAATRSMAAPAITSLNLLVFDSEGYFVEKATATLIDTTSDSATPTNAAARQTFSVTLTQTSAARTIHFVANCAEAANANFGHEDGLISNLAVGDDQDAYWQRMEFVDGISKSESGTNFNSNTLIPLVRNFARVTVKSSDSDFQVTGFAVVNTMSEGSVAAYAQNKAQFVEYTKMDNGAPVAKTYQEIVDGFGYVGFEAGKVNRTIKFTEVAGGATAYKYVRETTAAQKPCIIVRGTYDDATTYYKLDFMLTINGVKRLVSVLRNFSYEFTITSVAKAGYSSAKDALAGNSENNISFDEKTESLLNISDGTSQLFVNATSVTLVDSSPYYLFYKYIPDIKNGTADNTQASVTLDTEDVTTPVFNSVGNDGTVQSLYENATDAELKAYYKEYLGYNYVILTPAQGPQGTPLTQNVIVSAGDLSRSVEFTLREKGTMTVTVYDGWGTDKEDKEIPAAVNQKVNVDITIPAGLSQSIFPLEFDIEAAAMSIYPDASVANNNMPVRTGKSIITNSNATTFGFVKTLTWSEYSALTPDANNMVTITAYFRTNKVQNATTVYVDNKYFYLGHDEFENPARVPVTELKLGNIDSATGSGLGSNNNGTKQVTIYTKDGTQLATRNMRTSGVYNNESSISVSGLYEDDYVYFRYSSGYNTYYASIQISKLNSGAGQSLTFTTTNPVQ